jgi:hypothetical protein
MWTGTASNLLGALAEVVGDRAARFRARGTGTDRTINITTTTTTTPSHSAPEKARAQPSAPSASSACVPKSNSVKGFPAELLRTVANNADGSADGSGGGKAPTVRANPLKSNCGTVGATTKSRGRPATTGKGIQIGMRWQILS